MDSKVLTLDLPKPAVGKYRSLSRILLFLIALVAGFFSAFPFQHKCLLGEKWLESNMFWFLPLLFCGATLIPRRLRFAAGSVLLLYLLVNYGVAPLYLKLIHPNGEG